MYRTGLRMGGCRCSTTEWDGDGQIRLELAQSRRKQDKSRKLRKKVRGQKKKEKKKIKRNGTFYFPSHINK